MGPPAGRGIEAPGSIKMHHPVKGHPWAMAIQPRSAHAGKLDGRRGAPWGCKGDMVPSLIRPRQLLGKKPCSPKPPPYGLFK